MKYHELHCKVLSNFMVHTPLQNSFFLQVLNTAHYLWDFAFSIIKDALALGFAETFAGVVLLCVLLPIQDDPVVEKVTLKCDIPLFVLHLVYALNELPYISSAGIKKRAWKFGGSSSENSRPKKRRNWARGFIKAKSKKVSMRRIVSSTFPQHASHHTTTSPSSANASAVRM